MLISMFPSWFQSLFGLSQDTLFVKWFWSPAFNTLVGRALWGYKASRLRLVALYPDKLFDFTSNLQTARNLTPAH